MPLAVHFHEAHTELLDWLADVEQQVAEYEAQPLALNPPQIKEQQHAIKVSTSHLEVSSPTRILV